MVISFLSCNSDNKNLSIERKYEITYEMNIKKNNEFNKVIRNQIDQKISIRNNDSILVSEYNKLTLDYFEYLTNIEREVSIKGNEIFFEGLKYSESGEKFINIARSYESDIKKIIKYKSFLERFDLIFKTSDQKINDGYVSYLDYYFRGYPKSQSISLISDRKRKILEFEMEFINMLNN